VRVRLRRNGSSHNRVRTPAVEGLTSKLPVVGEPFMMTAAALEGQGVRLVTTSWVMSVEHAEGEVFFATENSTYLLEVLDGD
jgi:hypothetical protein